MYGLQGFTQFLRSYYTRAAFAFLAILDQVLAPAGTAIVSIIVSSSLDVYQNARSILRWAFYKSGVDTLKTDDASFDALPSSQAQQTANSAVSAWTLTHFFSGLLSLQSVKLLSTVIASGLGCVGDRYSLLCPSLGQEYIPNDISTQRKDTSAIEAKGITMDKSADPGLVRSADCIVDSEKTFHYTDAGDNIAVPVDREAAAAQAPPLVCTCQCSAVSKRRSPIPNVNPAAVTSSAATAGDKKAEARSQDTAARKPDSLKLSPWVIIIQLAMMLSLLLLSSGVLKTFMRTTVPVHVSAPVPLRAIDTRVASAAAVLETARIDDPPAAHESVNAMNAVFVDVVDDEDPVGDTDHYSYDSAVDILNYEVVRADDGSEEEEKEEVAEGLPTMTSHVEDNEMSLSHSELYETVDEFELETKAHLPEESGSERCRSKGSFRHYKSPGVSGARDREADAEVNEMEYYPDEYFTAEYESEREGLREISNAMESITEDDHRLSIPLLHSVALCATGLDILGIDTRGFHRLNDCIENEMSRYDRHRGFSFYQMGAYDRRRSTFWSTYEMKYSGHYEYAKKALQEAVRVIQSILPSLIELWESFATCFEKSLMSSFAFFYF
jgi:hypothetical protein